MTTLLGLSQHPGQLGSWGPVLAETARALVKDLLDAPWRISLTDDDGRVIWHGPIRARPSPADLRRHPSTAQAAYVRARDRRCRFPGCRRPAGCAQIDHTTAHAHGGPTDVCNLECLCARHHTLKTAGLWTAHQTYAGGVIVWTSHLGRSYITHPEPVQDPTTRERSTVARPHRTYVERGGIHPWGWRVQAPCDTSTSRPTERDGWMPPPFSPSFLPWS